MRAWVYRTKGKPADVLRREDDYPKPEPSATQVLVRVNAASFNPVFWKVMGTPPMKYMQTTPAVPEGDFAGTVEGGNLEGTGLKVGDEVFGLVPAQQSMKDGKGALAEYLVVDRDVVVKKPSNVSFEEASTFPLTTFTAYWALIQVGKLEKGKGQRVFIVCRSSSCFCAATCPADVPFSTLANLQNGGSGGVGVYAVQVRALPTQD